MWKSAEDEGNDGDFGDSPTTLPARFEIPSSSELVPEG